jgi:hypothetical protein
MSPPWARNPRALAGRLRRAQAFLRMLDIEIVFGREGRSGARIIRLSALGAKPLQGERDGLRRGSKGCLSRGWESMSTVTSSVPSASSASCVVDRSDAALFPRGSNRRSTGVNGRAGPTGHTGHHRIVSTVVRGRSPRRHAFPMGPRVRSRGSTPVRLISAGILARWRKSRSCA